MGGFLTAMQSFGLELQVDKINSIKIGLNHFHYYREENIPLYVVGGSHNKYNNIVVEKILKLVLETFWEKFNDLLEKSEVEKIYKELQATKGATA